MNVSNNCDFCRRPASLMCSRCLELYCSLECQILDWSEHKKHCVPFPKLCQNRSYLELISGDAGLPQPGRSMNSKGAIRQFDQGSLLSSSFPMGTVEISVQREATDSLPNKESKPHVKNASDKVKDLGQVPKKKLDGLFQSHKGNSCTLAKYIDEVPQTSIASETDLLSTSTNEPHKRWMLHAPLMNKGEVFEVVVQHVLNQPKLCWVVLSELESQCNQLLHDLNDQINSRGKAVEYDQIRVHDLYLGPYEDEYYRVLILEIDPVKCLVKVRLIDYGNEFILPVSKLREASSEMKELFAFAFLVEIQNLNRSLEPNSVIRISIIHSESDRKLVEMIVEPDSLLTLVGNSAEGTGDGGIVAILSSRKALILLSSASALPLMRVLYTQLAEEAATFQLAYDSKIGDLICVNSADFGWTRGLIIEQYRDNILVYTVDNGTVELVSVKYVRKFPGKYEHKPWMVLSMEILKVVIDEQEFKRMCYMPSFTFTFERLQFNEAQQTMKCLMKDGQENRVLAEVVFMNFECDLQKVGILYWPHTPHDKSVVRILSALDANTIVICPKDSINVYTELLNTVIQDLKRLNVVPNVKDVIVAVDDCMIPYRARVLSVVTPTEVEVLDIDSGKIRKPRLNQMYETSGFVNNLPVYAMKVRILDMDMSAIKDQASVLDILDVFRSEKREFTMHFEGTSYMCGVKLFDVISNRSLATILLEHHDKKIHEVRKSALNQRKLSEAATQLKSIAVPAAAAETTAEPEQKAREVTDLKQVERVATPLVSTINDLKLIELPVGKSGIKLTILDDTNLDRGAITVFEFTDENLKMYTTLNDKVNEEAAKIGGDGYCPKLDELCIAVFDSDKLWYRAVCLQTKPEKNVSLVQFIDFGNVASVKFKWIRSLPKALAFPYVAHTCNVIDHTNVMKKLISEQASLGYVVAQDIIFEKDQYYLKF